MFHTFFTLQAIPTLPRPLESPLNNSRRVRTGGSAVPPTVVHLPPPEPDQVGLSFLEVDVWASFGSIAVGLDKV
jgi:hypothetical protein